MGKTPKSPQMTSASMQCPSLTQEETESQFIRAPCCGVDGVFIFTPPVSSWTRKQCSQGSSSFWCCQVNDFHSSEFAILSNELPSISIDVDLFYEKKTHIYFICLFKLFFYFCCFHASNETLQICIPCKQLRFTSNKINLASFPSIRFL